MDLTKLPVILYRQLVKRRRKTANLGNVFEALSEVWLNSRRVLRLRQDLKQFIIGQEVESGEGVSLCFEVLAQTFLDLFNEHVALSEVVKETVVRAQTDHLPFKTKSNINQTGNEIN